MNRLEACNLSKTFPLKVDALNDVSFTVRAGRVFFHCRSDQRRQIHAVEAHRRAARSFVRPHRLGRTSTSPRSNRARVELVFSSRISRYSQLTAATTTWPTRCGWEDGARTR